MAVRESIKVDPAIERWNAMREDAYQHFRWTRRTTRAFVVGMVLIPGALYYLATKEDVKWDWRGKRKGESLATSQ